MYCPECGGEYRDGFLECKDCGVALVAKLPAPVEAAPDSELITVLETGDPGEMALVESLLMEAGIPYSKQGDTVQDLFGMGRVGGFNVLTGPARLRVAGEHAEAAAELLRDLPAEAPQDLDLGRALDPEPQTEAE